MEKIIRKSAYLCARDKIFAYIHDNELYGKRLPSETEFAQAMGISRNTVREAIRVLEQEGVVYSRHGVGTFVINKSSQFNSNITVFNSISAIIRSHGYKPGTSSVITRSIQADEALAAKLEIQTGDDVLFVERVRTADGVPVILVRDYLPQLPGMREKYSDGGVESILEFLNKHYQIEIAYVNCAIQAAISDGEIGGKLELREPTALIALSQFHYATTGKMAFYSDSYFVSSKFNFTLVRQSKG